MKKLAITESTTLYTPDSDGESRIDFGTDEHIQHYDYVPFEKLAVWVSLIQGRLGKSEEKKEFKKLALGTRFSYDRFSKKWVKVSATIIAEWDEKLKTSGWLGQSVCSFDEDDDTSKIVYVW